MLRKGFTLIELLIVMAVIAVLIGIAIPSFRGMQDEAKKSKAGGDLRVLKLAMEAYQAKHNVYPSSIDSLEAEGTVVQKQPTDPFATATTPDTPNYQMALSANGVYYVIWSVGPDADADPCSVDGTTGVVTVGGDNQLGTTNGTPPNTNWK